MDGYVNMLDTLTNCLRSAHQLYNPVFIEFVFFPLFLIIALYNYCQTKIFVESFLKTCEINLWILLKM